MTESASNAKQPAGMLDRADFECLVAALRDGGYRVIGPVREADAIDYREIRCAAELPEGWGSTQDPGRYRLRARDDGALFGYVTGVQSWKRYLFQPERTLWTAERSEDGFVMQEPADEEPRFAFLGVRACEIAGIALQDQVFVAGEHPDPDYTARRQAAFVVAMQCTEAGDTCFCASTSTGPAVTQGFDLKLTELIEGERHFFLVEVGSTHGAAIAERLPLGPARESDLALANTGVAEAAANMGRFLQTEGLKELIQANQEHAHWQDVAERCLGCTNCTAVCPTCFCHTTEDSVSLDGQTAERRQRWDSCFSLDFSHLTHGVVRHSVGGRYRQWMSHKLAHWVDQFGDFGCVGCGRCIAWCPAGIDITAEAAALRQAVEGEE